VVRLLLAKGAKINLQGLDGATPCSEAATAGHEDVVRALLSLEADSSIRARAARRPPSVLARTDISNCSADQNWKVATTILVPIAWTYGPVASSSSIASPTAMFSGGPGDGKHDFIYWHATARAANF